MSNNELRQALRDLPEESTPLDPARVIAGAHRRRRTRRAAAAGVASAAVVAVVAVIAFTSGTPGAEPGPAAETPRPKPTAVRTTGGAEALAACRAELKAYPEPGQLPKLTGPPVANLAGPIGSTVIFADAKAWVACDNSRAVGESATVSLLKARKLAPPSAGDASAFEVSGLTITVKSKPYGYFWAAGKRPAGVAKVSYTFPGGVTRVAENVGDYWIIQYREAEPTPEGRSEVDRAKIQVRLLRSDDSVVRTHTLMWGEQTCAHINHGC
ncbi:hypothetical protein OG394_24200 [Kribbella sp. NBC_01245]|uniref:hypothetical protein n=1 Tax=Kribbella sp. NBC_01245 TaxID=2903578 RepID=UPI002E2A61CC|nr:hypothetical protein [Kribbella sp. NBC_01245]